jgi:hypothetical protein
VSPTASLRTFEKEKTLLPLPETDEQFLSTTRSQPSHSDYAIPSQ